MCIAIDVDHQLPSMETYDVIIIGAGPAAQQAGLFLGRAKVRTLLIGDPAKSELAHGKVIGNLFGVPDDPTGLMLLTNGIAHLKRCGVETRVGEAVDLAFSDGGFAVTTAELERFSAKAVVIATGQQVPTAGIRGEKDFLGRGVHTCVACDGPFFKGKVTAVAGNGSHAAEEALELSVYAAKVTVYSQGMPWETSDALMAKLKEKGIVMEDKRIAAVEGEGGRVAKLVLEDRTEIPCDGVFLATGSAGGVTFANKLGLAMEGNFIKIDRDGKTSIEGVWAAGGVTGGNTQIAKSVGEGCNAAISVIRKLKGIDSYADQT